MMKLMSRHLIHRKAGLSQNDVRRALKDLEQKGIS